MEIAEVPYQPLEAALPDTGAYVLLKTGRVTPWDRWSILGWDPWCKWVPAAGGDPFAELQVILDAIHKEAKAPIGTIPLPLLMVAFAYDAGRAIEAIPATARTVAPLPDAIFFGFRRYLIADEADRRAWAVEFAPGEQFAETRRVMHGDGRQVSGTLSDGGAARSMGEGYPEPTRPEPIDPCSGRIYGQSNFARKTYAAAVEAIREMIAAGDLYQVNLSQQFQTSSARTAAEIFRAALERNPAPMMALVNAGDFQIISTSPERLVAKRGDRLISRPIKGTRPRGGTPEEDAALREELLTHPKDNAELAMIVDLIRNDLGRVAAPGSVVVEEPCVTESYANVHHLLATISARARADATWPSILRAVFPGGSITGCPKVQAMRVIEQMEGVRRGFYCGSIGYISANGNGDWNIAIRTITKIGDKAFFNLGGAVVYDSDPAGEYEETLHKGRTLFEILR
ncbi:MAG: anthranilate synthase component I family protein [Deltaproteobacteria bacterium]|nr:anthranilate synthase component I family protein [Deltaproteobacteria bacterium]